MAVRLVRFIHTNFEQTHVAGVSSSVCREGNIVLAKIGAMQVAVHPICRKLIFYGQGGAVLLGWQGHRH